MVAANVSVPTTEELKLLVSLMDLTSLGDQDNEESTRKLTRQAQADGNAAATDVAAVCVWGRLAQEARQSLQTKRAVETSDDAPASKRQRVEKTIRIAAVADFPKGDGAADDVLKEVKELVDKHEVDEVDLVLNYKAYLAAGPAEFGAPHRVESRKLMAACADVCHAKGAVLKVILESGSMEEATDGLLLVHQASVDAAAAGSDFLKTSTGKVKGGATLASAEKMLQVISAHNAFAASSRKIGFKASGGIREPGQALEFIRLAEKLCGREFAESRDTFRLGVSGLLGAVEKALAGETAKADASSGY